MQGTDAYLYRRLGLLAAAQGSGEISIFSIPDPADALLQQDRVRKGKARAGFDSAADKLIQLAPCASAAPESLSGSLVSCLEWLPSPPHDLLLVSFGASTLLPKTGPNADQQAPRQSPLAPPSLSKL